MSDWGGSVGTKQVVVTWTFLFLAFVVLLLRVITRVKVLKNFGLEDYVLCTAFAVSVVYASLIVAEVAHGQGFSDSQLTPSNLMALRKVLWFAIPCYLLSLQLTKIAILLQYHRIFRNQAMQRICTALLCFVSAYGIYTVVSSFFLCVPFSFIDTVHCLPRKAKWFSDAGVNIVTDLILLILPMPSLKGLNIPKHQKFELIAVFALGAFVCIVSIVRLKFLLIIADSDDTAQNNGPAAYFSSMEVSVGIICASLPVLRTTFVRVVTRIWPKTATRRTTCDEERADDVVPLDGFARTEGSNGIMRVITIFTKDERRDSLRRMSSLPADKMWDGGAQHGQQKSWIELDRRSDDA